jgi:hypothetical protein
MPISCTPQDLSDAAACFECQLSEVQRSAINTYLLTTLMAMINPTVPTDPQSLLESAAQFQSLTGAQQLQIQTYLLCQLVSSQQ